MTVSSNEQGGAEDAGSSYQYYTTDAELAVRDYYTHITSAYYVEELETWVARPMITRPNGSTAPGQNMFLGEGRTNHEAIQNASLIAIDIIKADAPIWVGMVLQWAASEQPVPSEWNEV